MAEDIALYFQWGPPLEAWDILGKKKTKNVRENRWASSCPEPVIASKQRRFHLFLLFIYFFI